MSQSVSKSALVSHSAEQMFGLVADIESYPDFLQWCSGAEIVQCINLPDYIDTHSGSNSGSNSASHSSSIDAMAVTQVTGRVDIDFKGIKQSFTTDNINQAYSKILLRLHQNAEDNKQPFSHLQGEWRFIDLGAGCKVELELEFAIRNRMLGSLFGKVFGHIASTQIDAFVQRAQQLY